MPFAVSPDGTGTLAVRTAPYKGQVIMSEPARDRPETIGRRRRWLIGFDPIFEGGRKGERAEDWAVEDELVAIALLGDVTIDLSRVRSAPEVVAIQAYAVVRDVDILVGAQDRVELSGDVFRGDLRDETPTVADGEQRRTIRVVGHTVFGDVTVRPADSTR